MTPAAIRDPLIVFDGHCVLCSANARFVLRHDRKRHFRLTTGESETGLAVQRYFGVDADATIIVVENGRALTRSDAMLAIAHGLEKIRTMGDSFMAVAGAPDPRPDHPGAAIDLARAVIDEMTAWRHATNEPLEVRVGLASGPLIGGVIGQRRMLFDVWGETVNTASRMESSGLPGRIQLAPSTMELVRDRYQLAPREIEVKGMGPMTTYLLVE